MKKLIPLIFLALVAGCSKTALEESFPLAPDITCTLENIPLTVYLDEADDQYTDTNWKSVSVIKSTNSDFWTSTASDRKDCPAPAEIEWSLPELDTSVLCIYTSRAREELVRTLRTVKQSVEIYNLIPERTYFYTVSDPAGKVMLGGNLITKGRRRMIKVSSTFAEGNANNCRDLGGLPTVDGKSLRYGLIYRGTKPDATTDAEKTILTKELGIKMDVDLRKDGVNSYTDKNWGVRYSLSTYGSWNGQNKLYNLDYGPNIKHTFTDIIEAVTTASPIYIHCSAGADRTGYICMLLEAALGVSQKYCSIDYELTSFSIVGGRDRCCVIKDYYFAYGMTYIESYPKGETFNEKARNILLDAGITADQLSEFTSAMVE